MSLPYSQRHIGAPIDPKNVPREQVPYFIPVEPAAQIAAGATATVVLTNGPRDFVWTHLAFSSQSVGLPAAGQNFRINILDVGDSTFFGMGRFRVRPVVGCNPGTSDKAAFELPVSWRFRAQTGISVEFENVGTLACIPYLVLVGWLDQPR